MKEKKKAQAENEKNLHLCCFFNKSINLSPFYQLYKEYFMEKV